MSNELLLLQIVASVLGLTADEVSEATSMQNCDRWDSLQHFNLILAVEQAFDVRFSSERIPELVSVQNLRKELASFEKNPNT